MIFNREPAAVLAAVQVVIALAVSFGLNLSAEQTGAILAFSAAVLGLVTRTKVSPAAPAVNGRYEATDV